MTMIGTREDAMKRIGDGSGMRPVKVNPDLARDVLLDVLLATPGVPGDQSPLARPGYKGGRKLSDYERSVAHALMRKGHPKSEAIAIARGLINRAAHGKWGRHKKVRDAKVAARAVQSRAQRATI